MVAVDTGHAINGNLKSYVLYNDSVIHQGYLAQW